MILGLYPGAITLYTPNRFFRIPGFHAKRMLKIIKQKITRNLGRAFDLGHLTEDTFGVIVTFFYFEQ